ncbi:hypothetical protein [Bifidobacterium eulemuris]|uniref:Uncharacterized protein n=1 Tax=Bifidobacterium eulemuris TaxID=1765219 RepID=A0A261G9W0_9BIFI|nr:hypothetical protein [Bifidobacterium eulemuris]OZG68221.1 hypothetical protein BEUL_1234 [Bifidobacterium eulemuris]QOL31722.1 hypothetical protein BE0216_04020 [Bifidobacterium eulemuris]
MNDNRKPWMKAMDAFDRGFSWVRRHYVLEFAWTLLALTGLVVKTINGDTGMAVFYMFVLCWFLTALGIEAFLDHVMPDLIREAREEAWAEGFYAGGRHMFSMSSAVNPYTEAEE